MSVCVCVFGISSSLLRRRMRREARVLRARVNTLRCLLGDGETDRRRGGRSVRTESGEENREMNG